MYPKLILKNNRERSVLNRHPWIFSGAVKQAPIAQNGEIIAIANNENTIIAHGFYDSESQIVCRLFDFGEHNLKFDANYWDAKIKNALALRNRIINPKQTNVFRLLHAEGDFFPGIIADIYDQTIVLQILIKGIEPILPSILTAFEQLGFRNIYLKTKTTNRISNINTQNGWLIGGKDTKIAVIENGLKYIVDIENGQKTGFFIDQRESRALVQLMAKNRNVLNTFAYTGGFSMAALAGNANNVVSVDISKSAIEMCENHTKVNNFDKNHTAIVADVFEYLRQIDQKFDLIILDPPAFAKSIKSVANAARGYKDLNLLAMKKIETGGLLFTYSCSQHISPDLFRKIVFGAAADAKRNVRILQFLSQSPDHPINIYHPEGEYLKGLLLQID